MKAGFVDGTPDSVRYSRYLIQTLEIDLYRLAGMQSLEIGSELAGR